MYFRNSMECPKTSTVLPASQWATLVRLLHTVRYSLGTTRATDSLRGAGSLTTHQHDLLHRMPRKMICILLPAIICACYIFDICLPNSQLVAFLLGLVENVDGPAAHLLAVVLASAVEMTHCAGVYSTGMFALTRLARPTADTSSKSLSVRVMSWKLD
jgi:hypothetical protein